MTSTRTLIISIFICILAAGALTIGIIAPTPPTQLIAVQTGDHATIAPLHDLNILICNYDNDGTCMMQYKDDNGWTGSVNMQTLENMLGYQLDANPQDYTKTP